MVLSHRRDCTPLPPVGTLREPAHTEVSLKTGKSQPLPFFFQFTGHQRNILWTLTSYYHSPSEADSMQKEENAGGRVHVHQRFSRKNTHVLRGLKIVENGPCSCGFSEHLSKHTQNIRQIVPTNVDHCLNSKSSFCIILFWYRRGNSAIKKYQKVFFFFFCGRQSPGVCGRLPPQLVLISAGCAQGYEVGCFRPLPSSLVTLPPSLAPHFPEPKSRPSDEPFLFALVDGLCEVGVVVHDGGVGALGGLRALRLVGVVGALVTEHVANEEDQGAEDGEDDHGNDPSNDGRVSVDSISYGLALSWVIRKISTGRIQVVQVPGVGGGRHGRQGERGGPAVGFHQLALDVHVSWGVGLPQGRLERGDLVELDSGEAAGESRGVVRVDLLVDLPCFSGSQLCSGAPLASVMRVELPPAQ